MSIFPPQVNKITNLFIMVTLVGIDLEQQKTTKWNKNTHNKTKKAQHHQNTHAHTLTLSIRTKEDIDDENNTI